MAALLGACQTIGDEPLRATAALQPTKGSKAFGEATFEQVGDKVRIVVLAQGLRPDTEHAYSRGGRLQLGDGMSAKGTSTPLAGRMAIPRQPSGTRATCRR